MITDLDRNNAVLSAFPVCALSFRQRLIGLSWRRDWDGETDGMIFYGCSSIHTFFMFMEIDVLFLDRECRVAGLRHSLKPRRIAWQAGAAATIELRAGILAACGAAVGDWVNLNCAVGGVPEGVPFQMVSTMPPTA